jgi:hypothetical protein
MIAAKYRLFSAEPKASKFPRHAHTEEVACSVFRFGLPLDKSRMVGNPYLIALRQSCCHPPTIDGMKLVASDNATLWQQ